jgi:hypothetical protein
MPSAAARNFVDMLQQVSRVLKDGIGACALQLIFPVASGQKANSQGPRATMSASPSALRRLSNCSFSTRTRSSLGAASTSQSCHSPGSPSSRIGAVSEASPPSRRFMSITSCSATPTRVAISSTWSGCRSPSSRAEILLLALRRLKNSFFWFAVVGPSSPATTSAGCIPGSRP